MHRKNVSFAHAFQPHLTHDLVWLCQRRDPGATDAITSRPRGIAMNQRVATFRGNKAALPSKPCEACGLAMSWRRRWAKNWADVKYCSDACRRRKARHG